MSIASTIIRLDSEKCMQHHSGVHYGQQSADVFVNLTIAVGLTVAVVLFLVVLISLFKSTRKKDD